MTILYAYLLICFGAVIGYAIAALMFTAGRGMNASAIAMCVLAIVVLAASVRQHFRLYESAKRARKHD